MYQGILEEHHLMILEYKEVRNIIVLGLLFSLKNFVFSHSPNEVSFSIYESDTSILVDTEFPWSIRNAVFMFDSTLNKKSTYEDIHNSLFNYIEENLIINDLNGDKIKLLKVINKKNQGHHENYQFVFEKRGIRKIKNTLLFNFSKKQKNYHVLDINGEKKEFVLTHNKKEEEILSKKGFLSKTAITITILLLFSSYFILMRKRRS